MASLLNGSMCSNCMRRAKAAKERNDMREYVKYATPGTYRKVSESNSGFSYKKAFLGTAIFGGIGAVAGINGKKTVTYKCNKCGHKIIRQE